MDNYRESVRAAVHALPQNALRMRFKHIMTRDGMWPTIEDEAVTYREQRNAALAELGARAQRDIDRMKGITGTEHDA